MEAREFLDIVSEKHEKCHCGNCPFSDVESKCATNCSVDINYRGSFDPVAIAEQVKAEEKPTPATKFEEGKKYRFSADLYKAECKKWAKENDNAPVELVVTVRGLVNGKWNTGPSWCYEVEEEPKPELPEKITDSLYCLSREDEAINAIIDYLKERENND